MKKIRIFFILIYVIFVYCFAQPINNESIIIEITNVVIDGGTVYLAIFSNPKSFKNENPEILIGLKADNTVLSKELSLPNGEYVISAYQDANDNQKLDYGLFGIPKEMIAISNYFGKGYPSRKFEKQKISLNDLNGKITIGLYQF